jgi:hypothetical protein
VTARQVFTFPPATPEYVRPEIETSPAMRADYAAAMPHRDPCPECQQEGHVVSWRIHPRPGPFPPAGIRTDLVECCTCCAWSCGDESFVTRLEREKFDDRDVEIEHLVDGRWVRFGKRFEDVA